ncbi:uncharacterized protein LOC143020396 isoform X2 [Oratosquilla oratoria]|uniref:uncharacterized protein LOC143020396 isoform X2 n=1 Tax=Oratosquilla oratoria TaxID=337810 RepID=UPI003F76DFE0
MALRLIRNVVGGAELARMRWSESHTIGSGIKHYLTLSFMKILGGRMMRKMEEDSRNFMKVQEEVLMANLKKNAETVYGQEWDFSDMNTIQEFMKMHPLTQYGHYESYVERIKKGEENVLTKEKVLILGVTSGTSGQSRLLPTTKDIFTGFFIYGITVLFDRLFAWKPEMMQLQKDLKIYFTPKERHSEGGILIGPNSSSPDTSKRILHMYSTPPAAYQIMTEPEALYVHLLFGLADANIGMIEANFASLIYNSCKTLENLWPYLVSDIRNGYINSSVKIPDKVRQELDSILQANPTRANYLEQEFSKGFDGIINRIWPHLNVILCTTTGSQEIYANHLHCIYGRGVSLYSPIYGATEGLLGINLWPEQEESKYALIPRTMFYEFIPVNKSTEDQPQTLMSNQVKEGETYELVVSNNSGLYRYRIGDVVKVESFYNTIPVIKFMYRQGQFLNVRGEKLSEEAFFRSLSRVSQKWSSQSALGQPQVVDYCCAESAALASSQVESSPSYFIFVELNEEGKTVSPEEAKMLDEDLCENHFVYNSFRVKGAIAPPTVYTVKPGTFRDLRTLLLENTQAGSNQLKIPRVLHNSKALQFLLDRLI